jgi:hypothetical protein
MPAPPAKSVLCSLAALLLGIMSAFPRARAQGTEAAQPSCASPTGTPGEDRVDCAAAGQPGLEPLAAEVFYAPRECGEAGCGVLQCCIAKDCHDMPGWVSSTSGNCDSANVFLNCAKTDSYYCSADGICPAQACCACGASSAAPVMSCWRNSVAQPPCPARGRPGTLTCSRAGVRRGNTAHSGPVGRAS